MPELPEVEVCRQSLAPALRGRKIIALVCRTQKLRQTISDHIYRAVNQTVLTIERRGKYLAFPFKNGALIFHLGMTGNLCIRDQGLLPTKHDHIDVNLDNQKILRFRDPRRFGMILWLDNPWKKAPFLTRLGTEPLSSEFTGQALFQKSRRHRRNIKNFLLDQRRLAGLGNIYASEALHLARILPDRPACSLDTAECQKLCAAIRRILIDSIKQGGSTIKDYFHPDGEPGYFKQELAVYGRAGQPCLICQTPVIKQKQAGRSTFYCPNCQN